MTMSITPQDITGMILAGTTGDLGLHDSEVLPRVLQTLMRLSPQVGVLRIYAACNTARYAGMGVPVWTEQDDAKPFSTPISDACKGILAGLSRSTTPYFLAVSGDTPRFPLDFVLRMSQCLSDQAADIVVATGFTTSTAERGVLGFCLMRTSLRHSLQAYLQTNGGSFEGWLRQQRCKHVARIPDQLHEHISMAGLSRPEPHMIA